MRLLKDREMTLFGEKLKLRPRHIGFLSFCIAAVICFSCMTVAKTTYVITDGDDTVVVSALSSEAESAMELAGISLNEDDTYTTENTSENISVNITRSASVTVICDGKKLTLDTYSSNVRGVLHELDIHVDFNDDINCGLSDPVYDGMEIVINTVNVTYSQVQVYIKYETERVADDSMYKGNEETVTEGKDGSMLQTYKNTSVAGSVTSTLCREDILESPVNEVIHYGTKKRPTSFYTTANTVESSGDGVLLLSDGSSISYSSAYNMTATAYTTEGHSNKITASGARAKVGIIAADLSVLPMGTKVYITSASGNWTYGYAVVGDTGGAVKNRKVDLFFNTNTECVNFGVRDVVVYVLN